MSKVKEEALAWVVRQSSGDLSRQEQAAFDAWFHADPSHRGAYLRARAIEAVLAHAPADEALRPVRAAPFGFGRRGFLASGLAAAGLAVLASPLLFSARAGEAVFDTAKGEFRKVPLADASKLTLNGASRVKVALTPHDRRIDLARGEAWFEVAKDKTRPFIVDAGGVFVRAVGTAFAVRRYAGGADVVVTEGVVEVWNERGDAGKRRMQAGDHAYVPADAPGFAVAREPGEVERKLAWRDGNVLFRDQTLAEAVAEFNRYNARTLVLRDPRLAGRKLVGLYRLDKPERFADDMHALLGVPVAMRADSIEIGQ